MNWRCIVKTILIMSMLVGASVVVSSVDAKTKKNPADIRIETYEKIVEELDEQYQALQKFTGRHIFKKFGNFDSRMWDKWFRKWDARNVSIKVSAKSYAPYEPLIYENIEVVLRYLSLCAYEYQKFFNHEAAAFKHLQDLIKEYELSLEALTTEVQILKEKNKILKDQYIL